MFAHWLKEKTAIPAAEVCLLLYSFGPFLSPCSIPGLMEWCGTGLTHQVERFASNYLLRVGNEQLDERRLKTRKRMSEAKDAAVRY